MESKYIRRIDANLKQRVKEILAVFLKWLVEGAVSWYSNPITHSIPVCHLWSRKPEEKSLYITHCTASFLENFHLRHPFFQEA